MLVTLAVRMGTARPRRSIRISVKQTVGGGRGRRGGSEKPSRDRPHETLVKRTFAHFDGPWVAPGAKFRVTKIMHGEDTAGTRFSPPFAILPLLTPAGVSPQSAKERKSKWQGQDA